jgi:hypothetical protein
MNNPVNMWDPTGHVAEYVDGGSTTLPDGFSGIPSWVREAHHRQQVPVNDGGILDELEQRIHRGGGNHTRHDNLSS